jgi:hypothetical protein
LSDWTWEYVPDAANVVGGLTQAQIDQVESLASRIADAVAVRRIGTPFDVTEAVSNVKSYKSPPARYCPASAGVSVVPRRADETGCIPGMSGAPSTTWLTACQGRLLVPAIR